VPKKAAPEQGAYLTIDEIAAAINKEMGSDVLIKGESVLQEVPRLSSGILSLDLSLGGGWAKNQWNEIVGPESSGKTALVFQTIAYNQAIDPDFVALFVAAEEFVPSYATAFGVDLSRTWVVESNHMEQVFELVVKAVKNRTVDLVAIDSLPVLVAEAEEEKSLTDGLLVSPTARIISTFLKKMSSAARRSLTDPSDRDCTLLLVNQWRDKIGVLFGDPNITPGGKAKNYYFFVRLDVSRDEWIQEVKSDLTTRVGQTIATRTFKNKTYRPQQRALMDFYFADSGAFKKGQFDTAKDLVNTCLTLGLFEGRYSFEGQRIANSKEELYSMVRQDLDLQRRLSATARSLVLPHLQDGDDDGD
jgi:recombination protein RecA